MLKNSQDKLQSKYKESFRNNIDLHKDPWQELLFITREYMILTLIKVQADCRWSMKKATLALISALYPSFNVEALFEIPPIHNNNIKIRKTTRQKKSIRQREFDIWKQFC